MQTAARTASTSKLEAVAIAALRMSDDGIQVSQFHRAIRNARRNVIALESILPEGFLPQDAVVLVPAQIRVAWMTDEGARAALRSNPLLTKQVGLALEKLPSGGITTLYVINDSFYPIPSDLSRYQKLVASYEGREMRHAGSGPVVADGSNSVYRRLCFSADDLPDSVFRVAYHIPEPVIAPDA